LFNIISTHAYNNSKTVEFLQNGAFGPFNIKKNSKKKKKKNTFSIGKNKFKVKNLKT